MACEHKNTEYIPEEWDTNVREDLICLDCGESLIDSITGEKMADKTKMILRNDPAKKRKKLGKVKDLLEQMEDDWNEFEHYIYSITKNKNA